MKHQRNIVYLFLIVSIIVAIVAACDSTKKGTTAPDSPAPQQYVEKRYDQMRPRPDRTELVQAQTGEGHLIASVHKVTPMEHDELTYADGSQRLVVTWLTLQHDYAQKHKTAYQGAYPSNCYSGTNGCCVKCGFKRWLCVEGIPVGCRCITDIESATLEIDCDGTGCYSTSISCGSF